MYNQSMTIASDIQTYELPDWMRRARRGVDWGILLVIAMSITVTAPFIFNPGLPHTNANENYIFKTADYAQALKQGWLYPRWSPNVLSGYGAPIPSFYPPLPTYTTALLQLFVTNDPVVAVRIMYVIALCGSSIAIYTLGLRRAGARAGILAAALYMYSPYMKLVAPHVVGDLPSVIMLAIIPSLFWAVDRLMTSRHPQDMLLVSLFQAGLCVTSFSGMAISFLTLFIMTLWYKQHFRRASFKRLLISLALGTGIASFYWIPCFLEQSAIHWQIPLEAEAFRLNLANLVTPLRPLDPAEMVATPQFTVGMLCILCGLTSSIICVIERKLSFSAMFLLLGMIIIIVAVTVLPYEMWLTGLISLFFAVGSMPLLKVNRLLPPHWRRVILPIILVIIWISSFPTWLNRVTNNDFGATDASAQVRFEQSGFGVAVLAPGQGLPTSISQSVPPNRFLIDSFNSGTVNKLASGQLSTSFDASLLRHDAQSEHFQIRHASEPLVLKVLTGYFPGWRAVLSEQQIPLQRNPETGLIDVNIPATGDRSFDLVITLGSTDVRLGAWIITFVTAAITLLIAWGRYRRLHSLFEDQDLLQQAEARLVALPILSFLLVSFATSSNVIPFTPYVRPGTGLDGSLITQTRTDIGLTLISFRISNSIYHPQETVEITLYWQAQRFVNENYRVSLHLTNNRDKSIWGVQPLRNPGYYPSRRWNTQQYISDRYYIPLATDIPPGHYQIQIAIENCETSEQCSTDNNPTFFGATGQSIGTTYTLPALITIQESP